MILPKDLIGLISCDGQRHKKHMYTITEVLHGVLYLEAHSNRFQKKKNRRLR
jgi:hypothetical protein